MVVSAERGQSDADGYRAMFPGRGFRRQANAFGHFACAVGGCVRHEDNELFATVTRCEVIAARGMLEQTRDAGENVVADQMAKRVVVRLEIIDIEDGQRQRQAVTLRMCQIFDLSLLERAMIVQVRQAVGGGERF